jgi:hypothetical protein
MTSISETSSQAGTVAVRKQDAPASAALAPQQSRRAASQFPADERSFFSRLRLLAV